MADPDLDKGLRGMHMGSSNGTYVIRYDAAETEGTQEHTVLHETYEIIRERLTDLHPEIERPRGSSLCRQADRFAAAALMQPGFFALFAETTGLDVIALQRTYGRAYSSLTIRLAEVMKHQPLLAVLYERRGSNDPSQWAERPSREEFTGHRGGSDARIQVEDRQKPTVDTSRPAPPKRLASCPMFNSGADRTDRKAGIRRAGHGLRPLEC